MRIVNGIHDRYEVADNVLNSGGFGSIYKTASPQLVYKEYHSVDKSQPRAVLDRLVLIGREILVDHRVTICATPESSINWPLDIVSYAHGRVRGVILPAIPPALLNEDGKPRGLEFLIMRRAIPPPANRRVFLLLRMAEILAYLDSQHLVHGDINGKNLAWAAAPEPWMYLIDCDGMVSQTPPPTHGAGAAGWTDPRVTDRLIAAHDHLSDWYALALAMYRGLLLVPGYLHSKNPDGSWPQPAEIPEQLDGRIGAMLHRALDNPLDGALRPSPKEWVEALVKVYLPDGKYDDAALRTLERLSSDSIPQFIALPPIPLPPVTLPPVTPPSLLPTVGWFARTAITGGVFWHVAILALICGCFPLALIYLIMALAQAAHAPSSPPGRRRALITCACYTALSVVFPVFVLVNALLTPTTQ